MKSTNSKSNRLIINFLVIYAVTILPLLFIGIVKIDLAASIAVVFAFIFALINPQWGLSFMVASLAIIEILPDIPLGSSISALLGAATLASYLFHVYIRRAIPPPKKMEKGLIVSIVLFMWIFISHPEAALLLGDRVWIWTLVQLWIVAWLAGKIFINPGTTKILASSFIIANLISVFFVFEQGRIGESIYQSQRGYGLAEGSNGTARYLILAIIFTYYLFATNKDKKPLKSIFYFACALILLLGVIYTVSRTGLLLIIFSVGLILISPSLKGNNKKVGFLLLAIIGISIFLPENTFRIFDSILPSVTKGLDTAGLRYSLWTAGIKMFVSSPLIGVGIGQFQYQLPYFGVGIVPTMFLNLTPHSMYIQLLAETGIIGFFLFVIIFLLAIKNLFENMRSSEYNKAMIGWLWFSLIATILVGAITKTDFADKILWVGLGIGFASSGNAKEIDQF